MKIADFKEAAMEWTMTIEGRDEYGEVLRAQLRIEKGFHKLMSGEIGLSIDDGKRIMSNLQEFVVKQRARDLCSGAAGLPLMRKFASRFCRRRPCQ
jgi:hypothetical protein